MQSLRSQLSFIIHVFRFQEFTKLADADQHMTQLYDCRGQKTQMKEMLEYYKFRKFVPLFADLKLGKVLHGYYYQRLKLYYNQVKRKLNLTVDHSSTDSFSQTSNIQPSQTFPKSKILDQLTVNFKIQETTGPTTIQNFKTQSKALEDLVNLLKANQKLSKIRPLDVHSEWEKQKKTSKQIFRDIILEEKKKKNFKNNKSKIFITFYSRDGSIKKQSEKKPQLKVIKSQKLGKSKDLKTLNKEKQIRVMQKLQKIKNQILDQKILHIQKNDREEKIKEKIRDDKLDSGKKTSLKLIEAPKSSDRRKSLQKLTINLRGQNLVRQQNINKLITTIKPKKSHSQPKLKQSASVAKDKSSKNISSKPLSLFAGNQNLLIPESENKELIVGNLSKKRPISRRKSLDLAKIKSLLPQNYQSRIDLNSIKQDYQTQRYEKMIMTSDNPNRLMIRTSNVSPVSKKEFKDDANHIVLEKSDNIVSIKKKKLEMLKKKVQLQKSERKNR